MKEPSNYPPGVTGCEPQITGEYEGMTPSLYEDLVARMQQLQMALVSLAAETPDDYPLLRRVNSGFDGLRRELIAALNTLKQKAVSGAFCRAVSGEYTPIPQLGGRQF